jgi:hypothetical protein
MSEKGPERDDAVRRQGAAVEASQKNRLKAALRFTAGGTEYGTQIGLNWVSGGVYEENMRYKGLF